MSLLRNSLLGGAVLHRGRFHGIKMRETTYRRRHHSTVTLPTTHDLATVFLGTIIHPISLTRVDVYNRAALGVRTDGTIAFLEPQTTQDAHGLVQRYGLAKTTLVELGHRFLMPGLVDTHTHAPQYVFAGLGLDLPLLEWLRTYTFPTESKFHSEDYAQPVYESIARRTLENGTTTCCYFATIHAHTTHLLVQILRRVGQRAFVGKVCMDRNAPDFYVESTDTSLHETEGFVRDTLALEDPLITPVITPRFVPTCSEKLMRGLGDIGSRYNIPIQSHISENVSEVSWVRELHPTCDHYAGVYDTMGLLTSQTIMAHGVYLSDDEIQLLKERSAGVSHCPNSNFSLCSGFCAVRKLLDCGVKVGLGTDCSGGYSASMLDCIRQATLCSKVVHVHSNHSMRALGIEESLYLATLGGADLLGLSDKIGNFQEGKDFDALVVDPHSPGSPIDVFPSDHPRDVLQKFLYNGDSRNVVEVFVKGRKVH